MSGNISEHGSNFETKEVKLTHPIFLYNMQKAVYPFLVYKKKLIDFLFINKATFSSSYLDRVYAAQVLRNAFS